MTGDDEDNSARPGAAKPAVPEDAATEVLSAAEAIARVLGTSSAAAKAPAVEPGPAEAPSEPPDLDQFEFDLEQQRDRIDASAALQHRAGSASVSSSRDDKETWTAEPDHDPELDEAGWPEGLVMLAFAALAAGSLIMIAIEVGR